MSIFGHKLRRICIEKLHGVSRRAISGVLCDIDGVLLRGKKVLAGATDAIKVLYERRLPVLFVTNQGLQCEEEKAFNLSQTLRIKVKPQQVVLSHTPLRQCSVLHDKFVLVLGQQNIKETAFSIGFQNICQIEDVQAAYPLLDMIDKKRRHQNLHNQKSIPRIEGILLLGEPIKWESQLQLVIDLLVTNGYPTVRPHSFSKQHIPIVACNTDLLWMAEAPIPRFGHGTFLLCLEALYKKITGNELKYTMITGKPFLSTFQYAEQLLIDYVKSENPTKSLDKVYIIGDNPDTDIYGGNKYNQFIQSCNQHRNNPSTSKSKINNLISILVETGVYSEEDSNNLANKPIHVHKDISYDPTLTIPDYTVHNIKDAVKLIINNENL